MQFTGNDLKNWRQGAALKQGDVARHLGISTTTLCRIEIEDRPLTEVQLAHLKPIFTKFHENSPIAKAAAMLPIVEEEEKRKQSRHLQTIDGLNTIGQTYRYKDFIVIPSQWYADWSGVDTGIVNQAIDRLEERNRLENEEHFFRLTHEEAKNFLVITRCDIEFQRITKGIVLITLRAVNTLSHYFNDPNSIALSNYINDSYTSIQQIANSGMSSLQQMYAMKTLMNCWIETEEQQKRVSAKITEMGKNLELTDAKIDATKSELEQHMKACRLTRDQIDQLEDVFHIKNQEYAHPSTQGYVQRHLKQVFLGLRAHGNTYKDIAAGHFPEALQRAKDWIPTPSEREAIKKRREQEQKRFPGFDEARV